MTTRIVELRLGVLGKNDEIARRLRAGFDRERTLVVNLVSSPGTGKTELLQHTLRRLVEGGRRAAALVGDLETDNDARRLAASGAPVRQINTHGRCHLEAEMIERHLDAWGLGPVEILFIENVGNLVCPSSYDLGEHLRAVLLSVTEGEDKPLKYPGIFNSADVAVITKWDLAGPCEFDVATAEANIRAVRPGLEVLRTSARTGEGIDDWLAWLSRHTAGSFEI
jgi:hydrogenase nickel incorporation protein HypB